MSYSIFTSNAGHSESAPGAYSNGYYEHIENRLNNRAFILTMNAKEKNVIDTTSDAATKYTVLREQCTKANSVAGGSKQLNISWHLNGGGGTGVEVYYYDEPTRKVAEQTSAAIAAALQIKNRGAKQNTALYFLNKTKEAAILIEACFIDNETDVKSLQNNRKKMVEAVASVLVGESSKESTSSTATSTSNSKNIYKGSSIVDYLKSINIDSSFSNRARLYVQNGLGTSISHYHGTSAQNSSLLHKMRGY